MSAQPLDAALGAPYQVKIRVRLYSEGIAPAALRQQLKNVKATIHKAGSKNRR